MTLVKLTTTPEKINTYNDNIKRCIKEYPDYFNEKMLANSIDDIICSYDAIINDPDCKDLISDVKDTLTDFTGIYVKSQYEFVQDYMDQKIIDNNPFYIGEKFHLCEYGVADNASQVIEYFHKLEKERNIDFGKCIICLHPITKKYQPEDGGWRWHKWGPYIGKKNPQCEYIYDEDDTINFVWCYHLYGVE